MLVLAGGDEVGPVRGELDIDDGLVELVDRVVEEQVARLGVVLADAAILVAGNDVLGQGAPAGDSGLGLVADNGQSSLVSLLGLDVGVDVKDDDVGQVAHALLGNAQELGAVLVEGDALDGRGELPDLEALSRLDVPQANRVVGRARGNHGRGGVDVDGPDGTDVAMVCSEALAVVRVPDADLLVLGDREDEVAIEVIAATVKQRELGLARPTLRRGREPEKFLLRRARRTYRIWVSARSCPERRIGLMVWLYG